MTHKLNEIILRDVTGVERGWFFVYHPHPRNYFHILIH